MVVASTQDGLDCVFSWWGVSGIRVWGIVDLVVYIKPVEVLGFRRVMALK